MRQLLCAPILALTLFVTSCGGGDLIRTFRAALTASRPLVTSLVDAGAIGQSDAESIIQDFNDGAGCADTLATAFNSIAKTDPNARAKKFAASSEGLQCFRVIVQRRNFEKNPRVKKIANIADGILASLVGFYTTNTRPTAQAARSEQDLEKDLKAQVEELRQAMKP